MSIKETLIVGAVGAAYQGKALAGSQSSPWVPIRFAFSFAAIAPVFKGLSAMQILILAGIGVSIDMANTMWETGLKYVATYGAVNAEVPSQVNKTAQGIVANAMRSQALVGYLARQSGCEFPSWGEWIETANSHIYHFTVPQECLTGRTNLQPGDLGGFQFTKARLGSVKESSAVDESRKAALQTVIGTLTPVVTKLGDKKFTKADYKDVFAAIPAYTSAISQGLQQIANQAEPDRKKGLESFVGMAGNRGWLMAGSYYWIVADANSRVVEAMADDTQYIPPEMHALKSARILYTDWDTYVEPNVAELTRTLSLTPEGQEAAAIRGVGAAPSQVVNFFSFIFEAPARFMASLSKDRPDAILAYSNTSRAVLLGIEGAVGMALLAKATTEGADNWTDSWVGKAVSFFSFGGTSAVTGAAKGAADGVFIIVLVLAIPLLVCFWVFAYIIPAIPFITWVAAVAGWIMLSVQAVIAAPLWLIGHSMPEGEGFAGVSGRAGYALFLSVLLRPVLLVLSMFVCMILMSATGSLIFALLTPFMDASGVTMDTGNLGLSAMLGLLILVGTVIGLFTWKMFELTTAMPDQIIRWVGQLLANLGDEGRGMASEATNRATSEGRGVVEKGAQRMAQQRPRNTDAAHQRMDVAEGASRNAHPSNRELALQPRDIPPNDNAYANSK